MVVWEAVSGIQRGEAPALGVAEWLSVPESGAQTPSSAHIWRGLFEFRPEAQRGTFAWPEA